MTLAVQTAGIDAGPQPLRSPEHHDEDAEIERLLSQKLLEGYALMERSCPSCATPLVKNHIGEEDDEAGNKNQLAPFVVPSQSFDQPFRPVMGVPFCVSCQAHVVTEESEINILEQCDSLKAKGQILISLQSNSEAQDDQQQDQLEHVVSGGDETKPAKNGYDATSFLCGTTASRQQVVKTPEPHFPAVNGEQGLEVSHEKAMANYSSYVEKDAPKSPPTPELHSDEKKDDDEYHHHDHHMQHATPETKEVAKSAGDMEDYSVRREIATKVLGAKMLQGYTLKETQCEKCGMPMMEYNDKLDCVVCPALVKKAKKKMKEQQRLAEQKERMAQKIQAAKQQQKDDEISEAELAAQKAEQALHDAQALYAQEEAEWLIMQAKEEEENSRVAALEAEEKRLLAEARSRAADEARIRAQEEEARIRDDMRYGVEKVASKDQMSEDEQRRFEESSILEETKRLEKLEHERAVSKMRRDLLLQEERKHMVEKSHRDIEIQRMEKLRNEELMEQKLQEDSRRMYEETELISKLEQEAADKARAAEEAIEKAKAALASVSTARKDIIAQTIAMAEAEAIAEAEGIIKADREDYKSPVVLPTKEDLKRENWETLRQEGRSVMTRRVMAGWTLLAEFCVGEECENSPLLFQDGKRECVVCGGCGNGKDGVYMIQEKESQDELEDTSGNQDFEDELENLREESTAHAEYSTRASSVETPTLAAEGLAMAAEAHAVASPTANRTVQELQDDFEAKRDMVSKEIGKRMIQGWTLLDMSCPNCVMPLMSDTDGNGEICVLCGLISKITEPEQSIVQQEVISKITEPNAETETAIDEYQDISHATSRDGSQYAVGSDVDTLTTKPPPEETMIVMEETGAEVADLPSAPTMPGSQEVLLQEMAPISSPNSTEEAYLSDHIRGQASKQAQTPRGDPPAPNVSEQRRVSTDPDSSQYKEGESEMAKSRKGPKPETEDEGIEVSRDDVSIARTHDEMFTISFPKNFNFSDEKAFLRLMAAKQRELAHHNAPAPVVVSVPVIDTTKIEASRSAEIITVDDAITQEAMASMFFESAEGLKAKELVDSGDIDAVFDLAEAFVRHNFGAEPVNGMTQKEVVAEIVEKFTESTYREADVKEIPKPPIEKNVSVDEIEQCRSPTDWGAKPAKSKSTFDFLEQERELVNNDPSGEVADDVSVYSHTSSRRRPRITPEGMSVRGRSRSKNTRPKSTTSAAAEAPRGPSATPRSMPPRPDNSSARSRTSGPRYSNPKYGRRTSPRSGGMVIIGGPNAADHDDMSLGGVSRAETVATQTLDSLLSRIEDCKATLLDPKSDHVKQAETAKLIEQLASAAMAVKKLEALGI